MPLLYIIIIIHLLFTVPPVFLTNQKNVSRVRAGGEAIFDCRAVGKPAPNVTWYPLGSTWPDGRVIEKGGFLTITDVHPKDYGKYRCGVSSMAGLITKDFTLIVICKYQCYLFQQVVKSERPDNLRKGDTFLGVLSPVAY